MPDARTYQGGCHCGRVRYEATTDLAHVAECNCSICMKRGALWTFVKTPQFKLLNGEDALQDYQFNKMRLHHWFCRSCGVGSYSQGMAPSGEMTFAVNVRCLDDVDASSLKPVPFDGRK